MHPEQHGSEQTSKQSGLGKQSDTEHHEQSKMDKIKETLHLKK